MERTTYMQKKKRRFYTGGISGGHSDHHDPCRCFFVAAIHYQSRLRRLEMDQTAKEIFLAAQNRLSLKRPVEVWNGFWQNIRIRRILTRRISWGLLYPQDQRKTGIVLYSVSAGR